MAKNKKNSWKEILSLYFRSLKDVQRFVPGRISCMVIRNMVEAISPYLTIWLSAQFINELATLRRKEVLLQWIIWAVAVTAACGIAKALLNGWNRSLDTRHNPQMNRMIMEKYLGTDYANVDDPHFRDLRAQVEQFANWSGYGINMALSLTDTILKSALSIFGAVALTVSLFTQQVPEGSLTVLNSPLFALAMLAAMATISIAGARLIGLFEKKWVSLADDAALGNRQFSFYCRMASDRERRLDIRTYEQQNVVSGFMKSTSFSAGGAFDKLMRGPYAMLRSVGSSIDVVFTLFVYTFTCLKAWAGAFSIGSVTQYVSAVTSLSGNVSKLLFSVDKLRSNHRFLSIIYELIDTPDQMYQGSLTTEKRSDRQYEVEFKDVSFQYPGSGNWALRHVNMKFKVGKRLAIVGENGSGKTTIIKLLCRLYDPQEGQILLNGIDIRKYRYDDYMNIFSVVFQDFQLIAQSLGSNVAGSKEYDRQKVEKALQDAGFGDRLETMENGLDTMLYKEMDESGVEVSGGEAQKIAIARALYKDAPFIILDEPTAALDPIAEAEIYGKFNEIAGDKTAIYISHRLSSCKFCDEIAVFDGGKVIQQGTHEELLSDEKGKYHALWDAQAQYYTKEAE